MGWRFVLSLIFALVVATFAIQNADSVAINFITWKISVSQALIILVSAIVGALIVMLLSLFKQLKMGSAIRSEKKTVSTLQAENIALRNKLDQATEKIAAMSAAVAAGKNAMAEPPASGGPASTATAAQASTAPNGESQLKSE